MSQETASKKSNSIDRSSEESKASEMKKIKKLLTKM